MAAIQEAKTTILDDMFAAGGEMGALLRESGWFTLLCLTEGLPQSLCTTTSMCLSFSFAVMGLCCNRTGW